MLEDLLQNKGRVLGVCGLIGLLALIRAYEDMFFYDPFLHYFKTDYTNAPIPETLLSRVETAELLGITLNTLKKFTRDTTIPAYGIGSRVFYKRNEVLASLTKIN